MRRYLGFFLLSDQEAERLAKKGRMFLISLIIVLAFVAGVKAPIQAEEIPPVDYGEVYYADKTSEDFELVCTWVFLNPPAMTCKSNAAFDPELSFKYMKQKEEALSLVAGNHPDRLTLCQCDLSGALQIESPTPCHCWEEFAYIDEKLQHQEILLGYDSGIANGFHGCNYQTVKVDERFSCFIYLME